MITEHWNVLHKNLNCFLGKNISYIQKRFKFCLIRARCFSYIITFPVEIISPPGHSWERGSMGQPTQCLTTFKISNLTSTALKPGKPQADIKLWQHAFTDHSSRVRPTVRLEGGLFKFCCNFIVSFRIIIIDPVCITKLYIPQSES